MSASQAAPAPPSEESIENLTKELAGIRTTLRQVTLTIQSNFNGLDKRIQALEQTFNRHLGNF
jgi:hypothetical protein